MTNPTFPAFGRYACDGDTVSIEHDGFTITATIHHDSDMGAPWDEHDGHGPVTDWVDVEYFEPAKGMRLLASDGHYSRRYYDFEEAKKIALRDGWGAPGAKGNRYQRAAAAAEADFRAMKAWCDDEWTWCGVALTVSRNGVQLTDKFAHALWGIECNYPGSDNSFLSCVAGELLADALDDARAVLARLAA